MYVRPVDVHDELLIAAATVARRLENQALAIVAEIRFRILTAEGELPDVPQVAFGHTRRLQALDSCLIDRELAPVAGAGGQENGRRSEESDGRSRSNDHKGRETMHAPNLECLRAYCRLACAVGIRPASVEARAKSSFCVVPLSRSSIAFRKGASYGRSRRFAAESPKANRATRCSSNRSTYLAAPSQSLRSTVTPFAWRRRRSSSRQSVGTLKSLSAFLDSSRE